MKKSSKVEAKYGIIPSLPVMRFFNFKHLPSDLQEISKPFNILAWSIHDALPHNRELEKSLDALLIAKDAAVRAAIPKS